MRYVFHLLILLAIHSGSVSLAGDWPQILGPNRDGHAADEAIPDGWPNGDPPLIWSREIGSGYSGPAVMDGVVYVFHRIGKSELLDAHKLENGDKLWSREFPATYRASINPDDGPRCVPVVTDDSVIVFGAAGVLSSVSRESGKTIWSIDLAQMFRAPAGYFGAGSTPIVVGDQVLVNVGGLQNSGIVAVGLDDGKIRWQNIQAQASYASPTIISVKDSPFAVFVTRLETVIIEPKTGEPLHQFPYGQRGPTVNAATPLVRGNQLFLTASYGIGAKLLQVDFKKVEPIWENDTSLSSQYNTPILVGDFLYGTHGREDLGVPELRCVEWETGKVRWTKSELGTVHLIHADGKLLAVTNDAQVLLIDPSPEKFTELSRFRAGFDTVRALPALSQGHLLIRESGRDAGRIRCFRVGGSQDPIKQSP